MINKAGAWCDICEMPILTGMVSRFGLPGLKNELHSCDKCKDHFAPGKRVTDWPDCIMKHQIITLAEQDDVDKNGKDL